MRYCTPIFIWLIAIAVAFSSIRHIIQAFKKRDFEAMGEGLAMILVNSFFTILMLN